MDQEVRVQMNNNNNNFLVSEEQVLLNSICHFFWVTLIMLSFTLICFLENRVTGKCGDSIANTPWAACLVADEGGVCPHNFKKLEDDYACIPYGRRTPAYKDRVCCLLGPVIDLKVNKPCCRQKCFHVRARTFVSSLMNSTLYITFSQVKDSPCLAGTPSSDDVEKKNHKLH